MSVARIRNPWKDGRDCDVSDGSCALRGCLHVAEDKGSYTPGVGYTSYHRVPRLVCMTRHLRGCPHPKPDPDPEKARCCPSPDFAKPRGAPRRQKCRTCGAWLEGEALSLAGGLPRHPASRCSHASAAPDEWSGEACWHCPQCSRWFDVSPSPHTPGEPLDEFARRRFEAWKERLHGRGGP